MDFGFGKMSDLASYARNAAAQATTLVAGSELEKKLCEACSISLNKNAVVGDRSAATPGGVRIGTPAMTTRGLAEPDFDAVAGYLHEAAQLALELQLRSGPKLVDFVREMDKEPRVGALRDAVEAFARGFAMP